MDADNFSISTRALVPYEVIDMRNLKPSMKYLDSFIGHNEDRHEVKVTDRFHHSLAVMQRQYVAAVGAIRGQERPLRCSSWDFRFAEHRPRKHRTRSSAMLN